MNENLYASPEEVRVADSMELRAYRRSLGWLGRGLMWMILSLAVAWGYVLTEWFFHSLLLLDAWYVVLIVFCVLQLIGMVYCWRGAAMFRTDWHGLVVISGVLFVVTLVFTHLTEAGSPILAMLFFGFSCWCWQLFLLLTARQLESRWMTRTAGLTLLSFSIAGFATLAFFGDDMESIVTVAMISGFAYFGLYAILLVGLWKRVWTLIARSMEDLQ